MGTNAVSSATSGQRATAAQFNSIVEALQGDFVPRGTGNTAQTGAGNLGTSTFKWDEFHASDGFMDNVTLNTNITVPKITFDNGSEITDNSSNLQLESGDGRLLVNDSGTMNLKNTTEAFDRLQVEDNLFVYRDSSLNLRFVIDNSGTSIQNSSGGLVFATDNNGVVGTYINNDTVNPDALKTRNSTASNQTSVDHNLYFFSNTSDNYRIVGDESSKVTWNFKGGPVTFFAYDIVYNSTWDYTNTLNTSDSWFSFFLNDTGGVLDDRFLSPTVVKYAFNGSQANRYGTLFTKYIPAGTHELFIEVESVNKPNTFENIDFRWGFYESR